MDAKAKGTFEFSNRAAFFLPDDVKVLEGITVEGSRLSLNVDIGFSNDGYLVFFEWLDSLAVAACRGHVDLWYDELGDDGFVRFHPGGRTEEMDGCLA